MSKYIANPPETPPDGSAPARLRQLMSTAFSMSDIKTLCFDLGVDFETLNGEDKSEKIVSLIQHCSRVEMVPALVEACRKNRPGSNWSAMVVVIDFTPELRAEAILVVGLPDCPLFTAALRARQRPGRHPRAPSSCPVRSVGPTGSPAPSTLTLGMAYVQSITGPFTADLVEGPESKSDLDYVSGTGAWTAGPRGLPLLKPPYGRITAIDLNRGEQAWMAPNGEGPRDHPLLKPLNLPCSAVPGAQRRS